jgi:hypothetical protein
MTSGHNIIAAAIEMIANKGARVRFRATIIATLAFVGLNAGSTEAADMSATVAMPSYALYPDEFAVSYLANRGFDRSWTYVSAPFGPASTFTVGPSWLPDGITVGISAGTRDALHCSSFCTGQFTSSTLGRVGFTVNDAYFYAWGGLETRRDLLVLPQIDRSYWATGAGVTSPFSDTAQFFVEWEQKKLRSDCGPLCANVLTKSDDYVVRVGLKQNVAGLKDILKYIFFGGTPTSPPKETTDHGPR